MSQQSGKGMNKAKQRRQSQKKTFYARQYFRTELNKKKAHKKHLAEHPNDLQAKKDILNYNY